MTSEFIDKVKGFLLDPTGTLIEYKGESLGDALPYYLILLAIYGILNGIIIGLGYGIAESFSGLSAGMAALGAIGSILAVIVVVIIVGVIALFIGGIILHIFVYIAGGRKDISTTLRAVIYSSTPNLLFGWIPLIGFIAGLWSLVLEILAIRELHEISTARAAVAVILPFILMLILVILGLAFFMFSTQTITQY